MPTQEFSPTGAGFTTGNYTPTSQNCLDFDGTNDLGTFTTASWASFGSSAFTVECQIMKKSGSSSYTNRVAFGKWDINTTPSTNEWVLALTSTGNDDKFVFSVEVGSTIYSVTSTTTISLNTWYHVAGVRSGTSISIIVNGVAEATTTNAGITTINTVAARDLLVGKIAGSSNYTNMKIANIRLWNVARSTAQVNAFKNVSFSGAHTGTVATYNCEQGTAGGSNGGVTTITDSSGNARDITLTGFALTGSTSNWVLYGDTASTNWECVATNNEDQTYMTRGTTSAVELFTFDFSTLPANALIEGVGVRALVRRQGLSSGGVSHGPAIRTNSTNYTGSVGTTVPSTGSAYFEPSMYRTGVIKWWENNPNTGARWTRAQILSLEAGYNGSGSTNCTVRVTWLVCVIQYRIANNVIQSFGPTGPKF